MHTGKKTAIDLVADMLGPFLPMIFHNDLGGPFSQLCLNLYTEDICVLQAQI